MKLFWFIEHPTHYHVDLLNSIYKEYPDLIVICYKQILKSHPWTSAFSSEFPILYFDKNKKKVLLMLFKSILKDKRAIFLIAGWNRLFYLVLIMLITIFNRKLILWSDTPALPLKKFILKKKLRDFFLNLVFSRKNALFFLTGQIGIQHAKKIWKLRANQVYNFPFVTNNDYFNSSNKPFFNNEIIFISSGRILLSHKGYDLAVLAFEQLVKSGYTKFKYLIAGTGPDTKYLENLIKDKKLENHIFLKGWIDFEELSGFYNSGQVFLHPSHIDPYPNSVLEAMSCGLCVIASESAGSAKDRIVDGFNGFLHVRGSVTDLVNKIKIVMDNPEAIKRTGKEARKTALNWDVNYNLNQLDLSFKSFI